MKNIWLQKFLVCCSLLFLLAIPSKTDASGLIGRAIIFSTSAEQEVYPAVAYNSQRQEYLVVWSSDRSKCDGIWAQFVSRSGRLIGSSIDISVDCPERRYPDVTYNSAHDQYLVVWE